MQRTARLLEDTHQYLKEMCEQTSYCQNDMIKASLVSFRKSKEYALLVLYNKEPKKIKE